MERRPNCMNGGDGPTSYFQNSSHQRAGISAATAFIQDGIAEELNLGVILHNNDVNTARNSFAIADLGCSVGPNTFLAAEAIIEAVRLKYYSKSSPAGTAAALPEFQVFFNDQVGNDFNTLFRSLRPDAGYFAAGVAGSFHRRLFPKSSIHFVHSSYALPWLSRVPKEVRNENSASWNKGRIFYTEAPGEVWTAYAAQYAEDLRSFLQARAEEVVIGGLMALLFPFSQSENSSDESRLSRLFNLLGSTLVDMAKRGEIEEEKVDSFNLPIYLPSSTEFKALVEENGYFSVVRTEAMPPPVTGAVSEGFARAVRMNMRAANEGLISNHFGSQVVDDLFEKYEKKLIVDSTSDLLENSTGEATELFVLLKRKLNSCH
ncbi:hypothetical protein H6P81_009009 [Aristolochia fimbriata]|uniref:S-adenosylmethionine-dependent methyltransferase n=1 Tax=Aristolochia fimbriata TaxID=158543 RepID=A0AAV7EK97_ARIFI|nr:hypothetical protein H6P81_009009 [Aristolochia fimbriata]